MERNTKFKESPQKPFEAEVAAPQIGESSWVNKFKNRFTKALLRNKEGQRNLPDMSIDIFYTPHATAEDAAKMRERFNAADVYIPELAAWRKEFIIMFRSLSSGKLNPEEFLSRVSISDKGWESGVDEMLYNSKKPVTFIDLPYSRRLFRNIEKFESFESVVIKSTSNFGSLLDSLRNRLREFAEFQKERENYMLTQFPIKMRELLEIYPQLKEKKQIKVLLSLGFYHTSVYNNIKKQGGEINREFSTMPYVYGFGSEAMRRYGFGKDVSDELAANMFLENLLMVTLPHELTERNDKFVIFSRRVVSQFSFQEAEEVFNRIKQGEDRKEILEDKLKQKGIKIPQTEQELDEFLAKPIGNREIEQ